jgi:hypothetical protein
MHLLFHLIHGARMAVLGDINLPSKAEGVGDIFLVCILVYNAGLSLCVTGL